MVSKIDSSRSATEVTSSIDVLLAIKWVALAWREVKSSTIVKCFKHAGIFNDGLNVHALSEENHFQDVDETIAIGSLISTTMESRRDTCSVEEYRNCDNDLAVCVDLDDEKWENFMDKLSKEEIADTIEEEPDVDEEFDISPFSPNKELQRGNTILS